MVELEELIIDSCKLSATDIQFRIFLERKNIYSLTLKLKSDEAIHIDGKPVIKVRLLYTKRDDPNESKTFDAQGEEVGAWQITFANKSKVTKSARGNSILHCAEVLKKLGAKDQYFDPVITGDPQWEVRAMTQVYEENSDYNPAKNYQKLHHFLIKQIKETVAQKHLTEVNVIDGGCGSGLFLKALEGEMDPAIHSHYLGFDYNTENITECNQNYYGKVKFVQGNLLELEKIIQKRPEAPTFLVLSGSLTRLVLHNGFEALQVLQQAALSQVDYLIGGGQGLPLINDFIAKRVGFRMIINNTSDNTREKSFYSERFSHDEILQNKIKKIQTRNQLDLSLSPNPLEILSELHEKKYLKPGLKIDFSFCQLSPDTIKKIYAILSEYSEINLVFWHWDKAQLQAFAKQFPEAEVQKSFNDWHLTASRNFFNSFFQAVHTANVPMTEVDNITEEEIKYYVDSGDMRTIQSFLESKPDSNELRILRDQALFRGKWEIAAIVIQEKPQLGSLILDHERKINDAKEVLKVLITNKAYSALYYVLSSFFPNWTMLDSFLPSFKQNNIDFSLIKNNEGQTLLNLVLACGGGLFLEKEDNVRSNFTAFAREIFNVEQGQTALHEHVFDPKNNPVLFKLFKQGKVDLEKTNSKGKTLLHCAALSNNVDLLRDLITRCPNHLSKKDQHHYKTPAEYLIENPVCNKSILLLLKDQQCDFTQADERGNTLLHQFMMSRKHLKLPLEVLDFYLEHYPAMFQNLNREGNNVTSIAIVNQDSEAMEWLLKHNFIKKDARYKFFSPPSLQVGTFEIIPIGNFGEVEQISIDGANKEIFSISLHYQGSLEEEKFPPELKAYLMREAAGVNIFLDEKNKTLLIRQSYDMELESNHIQGAIKTLEKVGVSATSCQKINSAVSKFLHGSNQNSGIQVSKSSSQTFSNPVGKSPSQITSVQVNKRSNQIPIIQVDKRPNQVSSDRVDQSSNQSSSIQVGKRK